MRRTPLNFKQIAIGVVVIMAVCLIPLMALGFYNHPLGDDYYYGQHAAKAIRESGNIFSILPVSLKGTVNEYFRWQGTYSAMFLMYLPPHVFGNFFYKLYPSVLLLLFAAGSFYMFYPIVVNEDKEKDRIFSWIIISSVFVIVATQGVPLCGETFYWYNGSMYYTGFLVAAFFFFGVLFRFLIDKKIYRIIPLFLFSVFLPGGNYASLLPTILTIMLILAVLIMKKEKEKAIYIGVLLVFFIAFTLVSVMAPGNALRAQTSYGTTPIKAILKSIRQCANYLLFWENIEIIFGLSILTPVFIYLSERTKNNSKLFYLLPLVAFLILSSSETAVFYGQNNGGAARLFDICYYMMLIFLGILHYTWVKFISNLFKAIKDKKRDASVVKEKKEGAMNQEFYQGRMLHAFLAIPLFAIPIIFWMFEPLSSFLVIPNSYKAAKAIVDKDASYYEEQYQERVNLIKQNPGKDLEFAPYDVPKDLVYFLYLGDLSEDPNDFNNEAFSEFYGISSVKVEK